VGPHHGVVQSTGEALEELGTAACSVPWSFSLLYENQEVVICKPGKEPSPGTRSASPLTLDFSDSRTARNKCPLFKTHSSLSGLRYCVHSLHSLTTQILSMTCMFWALFSEERTRW
jgi:hypothetical protein